jgi:hypothetical protein
MHRYGRTPVWLIRHTEGRTNPGIVDYMSEIGKLLRTKSFITLNWRYDATLVLAGCKKVLRMIYIICAASYACNELLLSCARATSSKSSSTR